MNGTDISIFIGTVLNPSKGKWYNLGLDTDKETIENDILTDTNTEWLVSDVNSIFNLKGEQPISYYIEYQELIEDLDDDELVKLGLILENNGHNYSNAEDASDDIEETYYFEGSFYDFLVNEVENGALGEDVLKVYNANSSYIDFDAIQRNYENGGDACEIQWNGKDYILETR